MHLQGMVPQPKPNSLQGCPPQACSGARTCLRTCGNQRGPLPCRNLLLDVEVGAVDRHQTIVANVVDETALKNNLWFSLRWWTMQQGETMTGNEMNKIILLTTLSTSSGMRSRKSQTHFLMILGSMAPLDPPTAEHPGPSLGYTFKK